MTVDKFFILSEQVPYNAINKLCDDALMTVEVPHVPWNYIREWLVMYYQVENL
jgi:hypothetical protein